MKRSTTIIVAAVLVAVFAVYGCAGPGKQIHGPANSNGYRPLLENMKIQFSVTNRTSYKMKVSLEEHPNALAHILNGPEYWHLAPESTLVWNNLVPQEDGLTLSILIECDDCADTLGYVAREFQFRTPALYAVRPFVITDEMILLGEKKQPAIIDNYRNFALRFKDNQGHEGKVGPYQKKELTVISGPYWIAYWPESGLDRYGQPAAPETLRAHINRVRERIYISPSGQEKRYGSVIPLNYLREEWLPAQK